MRAKNAADEATKLEAKGRAQLHEAEAEMLSDEIEMMKSQLSEKTLESSRMGYFIGGLKLPTIEPAPCCRQDNLAYGRTVTASSQEEDIDNFAQLAVDGDLSTRWCAEDDSKGQWIQVDLGKQQSASKNNLRPYPKT